VPGEGPRAGCVWLVYSYLFISFACVYLHIFLKEIHKKLK